MTKRFSVEDVATMLRYDIVRVRHALERLSDQKALSAETFLFNDAVWRIAPTDVVKIQLDIKTQGEQDSKQPLDKSPRARRIVKRATSAED